MNPHKRTVYINEETSNLKRGIDIQREYYKQANIQHDYDTMANTIENIKSEIKDKALAKDRKEDIIRITKILTWYKTLETRYTKKTPTGLQIILPPNITFKIDQNLQVAYELTVGILNLLDLI